MGKLEKTFQCDMDELAKKLDKLVYYCPMSRKMDEWTTEANGVRCIVKVFEKHAPKPDEQHASMALTLFDTGDEVRLCAITSGTSNLMFFNPYSGCEGALMDALNTALEVLDYL